MYKTKNRKTNLVYNNKRQPPNYKLLDSILVHTEWWVICKTGGIPAKRRTNYKSMSVEKGQLLHFNNNKHDKLAKLWTFCQYMVSITQ